MAAPRGPLAAALVALVGTGAAAEPSGGLVFDEPTADLGRVEGVGTIEHAFAFRVEGDRPVRVVELAPSCGCLGPSLSKRSYLPGESGRLVLAMHVAGQTPGPHRYGVSVTYHDGVERRVRLAVDLDLYKPIVVDPPHLLLYPSGDRSHAETLTVRDERGRPLTIEGVDVSSDRLRTRLLAAGPDPAERRIGLLIEPGFPPGRTEERVRIRLGDERFDEITIPVAVVRESRIRVLPERLDAGVRAHGDRPLTWQLLLLDARRQPIEIESVTTDLPGLDAEFPRGSTSRSRVRLSLDADSARRPLEFDVRIAVRSPEAATLVVPGRLR